MTILLAFILFICALLIQVYYYIHRLIQVNRITAKTLLSDLDFEIPVSVVICAHDEEENLRRLIPLILKQNHRNYEVVVVNDRSNDNTYDYLLEQKHRHKNIKIVKVEVTPVHINTKKYALTLGIKAARNEHILLTDADCTPSSDDWITFMVKAYDENTEFVLGYSPYQKLKGFLNSFIRFETLFTGIQYLGAAKKGSPYMGVGRNLSYRKSLFVNKKGFKFLNVTGGDDDLFVNEHANGLNTKIVVGRNMNVQSIPKQTLSAYLKQKLRHLSVGKLYKKKDKVRIGLIALSQILFWILLIVLILYRFELYYLLGGYILKLVLFTILFYQAGKRFGDKINLWLMPLFDFLWFIFYLVVGTRALFTKKVKWN
jgi:glycosyltransferase involved in cell wall biosynthesis